MKTKPQRNIQFNVIFLLLLALIAAVFPGAAIAGTTNGAIYYVDAQEGEWMGEQTIYRLQGEASHMPLTTQFYATDYTGTYPVPITAINFNCSTVCQWDAYLDLSGLNPGTYKLVVQMRFASNAIRSDIYPDGVPPTPDCHVSGICI